MPPFITVPRLVLAAAVVLLATVTIALRSPSSIPDALTAVAARGSLNVTLTEGGSLRPAESIIYRSRVAGREIEVTWLAPEGEEVKAGDPVVRLDTSELELELERANQALRQAKLELQVAEAERQAATFALESVATGKGALDADEARFNLRAAEQRAERLKYDYDALVPMLERGFVTREELAAASAELEQAQAAAEIARRRATIVTEQTVPQQRQRAALDVAHRESQVESVRQRVEEAASRSRQAQEAIDGCTIRAQHGGLVVYEDNLASNPRRKVRVGDRVTPSQGLLTIPEVRRMLVDASFREADLHRVRVGHKAVISLEAYPDLRLGGAVISVGTVAHTNPERPYDGKRFDVVVEIDRTADVDLRPEMTASVELQIATRRNVLLVPINAVFERGPQRIVRVAGTHGIEARTISTGLSDAAHVEILQGLQEGERVSLVDEPGGSAEGVQLPQRAVP